MTGDRKAPVESGYEIGFRKPPKNRRFRPGESGNARGRPKGRPTLNELFLREASKLITVKKGDEVARISKAEGLVTKLVQMALQGDMAAMRLAVAMLGQPQVGDEGVGSADADLGAMPDDEAVGRILARYDHLRAQRGEGE